MTIVQPPISKLPVEILSNIFFECIWTYRRDCDSESRRESRKRFIDYGIFVSHVCKTWRSVVLDDARLWTFIITPDYSLHQVKEYILRSKSFGLTVFHASSINDLPLTDPEMQYQRLVYHHFKDAFKRIKHLRIYELHRPIIQYYLPIYLKSTPNLKSLYISLYHILAQRHLNPPNSAALMPIRNPSSALSKIHMDGVLFNEEWPREELLHLALSHAKVTMDNLLRILDSASQKLRSLELSYINIEEKHEADNVKKKTINFPQLANLSVNLYDINHIKLFPLLELSTCSSIDFHVIFAYCDERTLKGSVEAYLLTIKSFICRERELRIEVSGESFAIRAGKMLIEMRYMLGGVWYLFKTVLSALHTVIPLEELRSLDFYFTNSPPYFSGQLGDVSTLKGLLEKTKSLQHIRIGLRDLLPPRSRRKKKHLNPDSIFLSFQVTLMEMFTSVLSVDDDRNILPVLQSMALKGFNFRRSGESWTSFEVFLSCWRKSGRVLHIEEAGDLTVNTSEKVRLMIGVLYVDGVRV